jgi:predicted GNAT family N-acyltransferase
MANDDKILELLLKQNSDVAATKNAVEQLSEQMSNLFGRVISLENYRANEQGKEQGIQVTTAAQKDILSRTISIISAILAAGAAYFSTRGH